MLVLPYAGMIQVSEPTVDTKDTTWVGRLLRFLLTLWLAGSIGSLVWAISYSPPNTTNWLIFGYIFVGPVCAVILGVGLWSIGKWVWTGEVDDGNQNKR